MKAECDYSRVELCLTPFTLTTSILARTKTYVPRDTVRPRALLSIVIGVEFPGLTACGLAGTCSSDKTWGHYWEVNMVTWLLLGNIYHCIMFFSSYPHLLARLLWVHLEPPPCLFPLTSLPAFVLCWGISNISAEICSITPLPCD